jgi:hypothetical protein
MAKEFYLALSYWMKLKPEEGRAALLQETNHLK